MENAPLLLCFLIEILYFRIFFTTLYRSTKAIVQKMRSCHLPDNCFSDDSTIILQVRRKKIWKDTLRAVKQPNFSSRKWLKVEFIGEAAIDDGGPRREYLRLGMREVNLNNTLFQGTSNRRAPTHNVHLLCTKEYQEVGRFFAMSILQGGPPPSFLAPTIAHYILYGSVGLQAQICDIPDNEIQAKVQKVCIF